MSSPEQQGPRQTAPGSSKLDDASANHYRDLFGVRYLHVQQHPGTLSRAERRGGKQRRRRR